MKNNKNLKFILTTVLLVAVVVGSSVLYQKLSREYVGSGNLVTDSDAILSQLGRSAQSENDSVLPDLQGADNSADQSAPDISEPSTQSKNEEPIPEENSSPQEEPKENEPDPNPEPEPEQEPEPKPEPPKNLAPDFTVLDENGNEVKLYDFRGKPVVLNFWASWCYYCKKEMPDFNAAFIDNPNVHFLMVNATDGKSETVESAKKFKENGGYDFNIYFDVKGEADRAYNVTSYPITYFISAEGEVIGYSRGTLTRAALDQGIMRILPAKKED